MFTLSTQLRYINRSVLRARLRQPKYWIFFLVVVYILWYIATSTSSQNSSRSEINTVNNAVWSLRKERFLKYQASEAKRSGPGEHGESYSLTDEEQVKYKDINEKEGFNFGASERVSLERSLNDYRSKTCQNREYPKDLPKASVIIVYHNEAFSVIMRTAHSVINRTPPEYLEEIILLDDSSTRPELLEPLQDYIKENWPDNIVRVVRTPERYGLIRAKLFGAKDAVGDVLVFLDAHCEASPGWSEPILNEIKEDPTRVICPIIDNIHAGDLRFSPGGGTAIGGFWWSMHFSWEPMPAWQSAKRKSNADAYASPTMAGGLFAADRKFFFRIGAYDDGMQIWGGENLDLSFRTWMCGGSLLFHPCSHVGHIFRATHPYGFPDKTADYHGMNSKRVAEVWMDEYKQYYYLFRRDLVNKDVGDLTERKAVREREKCHSFEWFLDNVYPQKFKLTANVVAFGNIRNPATNMCFDVLNKEEKWTYPVGIYPCHPPKSAMNQIFSLTPSGKIRREGTCLSSRSDQVGKNPDMDTTCHDNDPRQLWDYNKDTGVLQNKKTGLCVDAKGLKAEQFVLMKPCDGSDYQKWEWSDYYGQPKE